MQEVSIRLAAAPTAEDIPIRLCMTDGLIRSAAVKHGFNRLDTTLIDSSSCATSGWHNGSGGSGGSGQAAEIDGLKGRSSGRVGTGINTGEPFYTRMMVLPLGKIIRSHIFTSFLGNVPFCYNVAISGFGEKYRRKVTNTLF